MHITAVKINREVVDRCIDACSDCQLMCIETIGHFRNISGKHDETSQIKLLRDCIDICVLSIDLMIRGSELINMQCFMCADACERCAESCESFGDNDLMQACAKSCWNCSDVCREVAGPSPHPPTA
jgi:hypothetical protein